MNLNNYKRFLGDSDKIVKKYFTLKEEAKEKENLKKIKLEDFFQPITSIFKKEQYPLIDSDLEKNEKEDEKEDKKEDNEEDNEEDEKIPKYDDNPPEYGKTLYFENLNDLYDVFPIKERNSSDFYYAYFNVISKKYDYTKDLDLINLSNKELNTKKEKLNKLSKSTKNQSKYNYRIEEIDKNIKKQKKEILEEINKRKRMKSNGIGRGRGIRGRGRGRIGKGIKGGNQTNSLIYYNNPQQLIDRLRLLVGSKRAGNTNPEIDNEIIGISDELVKKGLIMNEEYTRFLKKNLIKF